MPVKIRREVSEVVLDLIYASMYFFVFKPQKNKILILGGSEAQPNQERGLSLAKNGGDLFS